ncbi:MAG: trigger factor [Actinomycetota bacterium]|nr:trigger factor [Actinomycetota bacterium]
MASAVKTSVTELPESRVRVEAEVSAQEVERRLEQTARALGRELKIPGFRKGKVPPPIVLRRMGRDTVLDEAVRSSLGSWYVEAIDGAGIAPVGDPELDLGQLPGQGENLTFSIEIGVRPTAVLGGYEGLEVGRREPAADQEAIDSELAALRERLARLEAVQRAAQSGDYAVIDYAGSVDGEPFEGGSARDQLVELGSGRLVAGFEEQLVGASAGDTPSVEITFPEDYGARALAGKTASFEVTVKEVKAKHLPDLDDDFASDAAGFDSLDELRADFAERLREADEEKVDAEFREAAVDAAVALAKVEVPDRLVEARAAELWQRLLATMERQGIPKEAYLGMAGRSEEDIVAEARPDAEQALRREAVLAAIVEAEGIEPGEEDVLEAIAQSSEAREGSSPQKLLEQLRSAGRLAGLREDIATRKAVDLVAERAKPIPLERAEAREKLWSPEKGSADQQSDDAGAPGKLWTPGS